MTATDLSVTHIGPGRYKRSPQLNSDTVKQWRASAIAENDSFWLERAKMLDWQQFPESSSKSHFGKSVKVSWFADGVLNASVNCIDRHLAARADQIAIIWQGDEPNDVRQISYAELSKEVNRTSNMLKKMGVAKGETVTIYMPMVPEAAYVMLACARIGAVHSVVFAGFSAEALRSRINDCKSSYVITADEAVRGGKTIPLKATVDEAIKGTDVSQVLMLKRTGAEVTISSPRDVRWEELYANASDVCAAEPMGADDPLFILYTSGSTGQPKGILHGTGGYLLYAALTHKAVFDHQESDVFWCTADVGWITGHSYVVYGPLCNGGTTLMFEGVPSYPDASRFWQVVDQHSVTSFYTAPTAIRMLMKAGDEYVKDSSRDSLRLLGTVGEPINPEAWHWYDNVVGENRCPIMDTWWQTETGGHLITTLPGQDVMRPGSAGLPFFGIEPVLLSVEGEIISGEGEGLLCMGRSWPGQAQSIQGDHARYEQTYFSQYDGYYFTGDGARRDADGYIWITGRVDDVINVSGHRMGTAEVESALVTHPAVCEAAVVGYPHEIKGQGIYAYVILQDGQESSDTLIDQLIATVRKEIGAIAKPDVIHVTPGLPKTRSGKIMRRILRKIAENDADTIGDVSTLNNPEIVESLIAHHKELIDGKSDAA